MIVCTIGYGYLAKFTTQRLCKLGITCIGITSKTNSIRHVDNLLIFNRNEINRSISLSTHLIITAPPEEGGCSVFKNYFNIIKKSNIRSIVYISSTGVYGNHNGSWVDEKSNLNAQDIIDKIRIDAEKQWIKFCNRNKININIIRISGFYGPERLKVFSKNKLVIIDKKGHFFSRIHILDAARLISKIILESNKSEIWNISDETPTSRADFLLQVAEIKNINDYHIIEYEDFKKKIPKRAKKFWMNNKKVSIAKVKNYFKYKFIFPSFKSGLLNLKEYL